MTDARENILQFEDGSETITLFSADGPQIKWYPNDMDFIDRLSRFNAWLPSFDTRMQNLKGLKSLELDEEGKPIKAGEEYIVGSFEALGKEFMDNFDAVFNAPISAAAFKDVSPLSPTKTGGLVCENLLDALMPRIEASFEKFSGAREKYTNRFKNRAQRRAEKK